MVNFTKDIGIGDIEFQYPAFWKICKNSSDKKNCCLIYLRNYFLESSSVGQIIVHIKIKEVQDSIIKIASNYSAEIKSKFKISGGFLIRRDINPHFEKTWFFRPNMAFSDLPLYFNSAFLEIDNIMIIISILGPLPNQSETIWLINEHTFATICNTIQLKRSL
ncbi:MAG: hypothetical protein WAV07_15895 [Candidatus Contendobacter sp.]